MPSTTRHASNAPRKRAPSRKVQENANKPQGRPRKRAKTQKKPVNSTPPSPASSTSKTVSEPELPSEIDVSDVQFTLSTSCILNAHELLADSDIVKLGEFSYHAWNTKCIRKLAKAGEEGDFDMDWVNGSAVISARGITKANHLSIIIEDESGWKKAEKFVERWMKEFKREIVVKLTGTWRKKKGNVFIDENDEQDTGKPKAMSATAKLTAKIKQQTIIDNTHIDALMSLHKCERKNCPNHDKNGWCFDADGIHLKLNNVHLRSWSIGINNEEASLDSPPSTLPINLMPARASESNPYRKKAKSPPPAPTSNPVNPASAMPHFFPYPMPSYPPYIPPYPLMPGMPYKPSSPIISHTNPVVHRTDPIHIAIPSSPPEEVDPVDRMHTYFDWLGSKSPSQVVMLLDTKNSLLEAGHNFNTIFRISESKWESLHVPEGIMMQILHGMNRFKKVEHSL